VPWIAIEADGEQFFGGIMWSGASSLTVEDTGAYLQMSVGLPQMAATVGPDRRLETPHGFFGVAANAALPLSLALRRFVIHGVRCGRPLEPLTTYNTWFVRGAGIDEAAMREEIERAARLGFELFVVDAGWYAGAGAFDKFDFTSGLGSWAVDRNRFPSGCRRSRPTRTAAV
jgi:alpha-galactosidase